MSLIQFSIYAGFMPNGPFFGPESLSLPLSYGSARMFYVALYIISHRLNER